MAGIILAGTTTYRNSERADQKLIYSNNTMISALYNDHKKRYWEAETGRTIDRDRDDITTSEGQSYTLLRAAWMSDQATFDKTWEWTQKHLQREDKLFAWKWGQKADGTYGVIANEGGGNTSSNADTDIAFALLMAAGRWQQQEYLDEAKAIIPEIWEAEVVEIDDKPYLASNDVEKQADQPILVNPSYFAPYAYREFAKVDRSHDWDKLVADSYATIDQTLDQSLDTESSAKLPPDWMRVHQESGALLPPSTEGLSTQYGFDAMRTPWRLALDYQWNNEPRAGRILQKMGFLGQEWQHNRVIYSVYNHDGTVASTDEVPAAYGGNLGYFAVHDRRSGQEIYDTKLKSLYDQNSNGWHESVSYYSANWAWFGMAMFDGQLDNPAGLLKIKEN